jgi:hypothetical protein
MKGNVEFRVVSCFHNNHIVAAVTDSALCIVRLNFVMKNSN